MESKNKFWKGVGIGALVTTFVGLLIVGVSMGLLLIGKSTFKNRTLIEQENGTSISSTSTEERVDGKTVNAKMKKLQVYIDEYFLFDVEEENLEDGVYSGILMGLEDPYSVYYNEEDYKSMLESTSGLYYGIGVLVSQNMKTGAITVVKPFKGGPGLEAGLLPGDIFYKVGDKEITGMDVSTLVNTYIKGEEGTDVTITIYRPNTSEYLDFTIERRQVEVPTVEYSMLENHIGYLLISSFEEVTYEQFKKALEDLQAQGMEKLIVDLRGNPGGLLTSVTDILDDILPDGLIMYTEDKNGEGEKYYSDEKHQLKMPMAILVNENSASASEVFAGAIKDYNWGTLVGTTTFGKGIVQSLIPLGDGTAVKLTVSKYFTPNGNNIHEIGIEPDIEVELDESLLDKPMVEQSEDNQLQKAIEVLSE